jgi:hypothetical protein
MDTPLKEASRIIFKVAIFAATAMFWSAASAGNSAFGKNLELPAKPAVRSKDDSLQKAKDNSPPKIKDNSAGKAAAATISLAKSFSHN